MITILAHARRAPLAICVVRSYSLETVAVVDPVTSVYKSTESFTLAGEAFVETALDPVSRPPRPETRGALVVVASLLCVPKRSLSLLLFVGAVSLLVLSYLLERYATTQAPIRFNPLREL